MEGLAYIGKVMGIDQIEGADRIEAISVFCGKGGSWSAVAQKGQFAEGDFCEVYLPDSLLPAIEKFAFIKSNKYIVKQRRFLGVPSEVVVQPIVDIIGDVGDDITALAGVEKYSKPVPASMGGFVYGNFPTFIPKTDEPNFQTVPKMIEALRGKPYYSTVKYDGSSATAYRNGDHFGCCSRTIELKGIDDNIIWKIARQYDMEKKLPDGIAIQFEIFGEGIQDNPLRIKGVDARLFNIYHINQKKYGGIKDIKEMSELCGMPVVDIVDEGKIFDFSNDSLREYAEGQYPNGKQREGVVVRPIEEMTVGNSRLSFKVINLRYKH